MPLERTWKFFRHHDDGGSAPSTPQHLPDDFTRIEDARWFSQTDIVAMNARAVDYVRADELWQTAYGGFIAEEERRFLICLANYVFKKVGEPPARPWVSAQKFYECFMTGRRGGLQVRSLRYLSTRYDEADVVSSEKEDNATMLYFTGWQKHSLLVATGVRKNMAVQEVHTLKFRGQHLGGPSK